uniref:Uncharacterized protein n=1 Tax=Rangifer tarandus platyrhynchus TaxID=3082113 RepID=A0ACB0EE14_RANTA|nr:unnamed protein product [Rangifer tarandus platyrhynchus]
MGEEFQSTRKLHFLDRAQVTVVPASEARFFALRTTKGPGQAQEQGSEGRDNDGGERRGPQHKLTPLQPADSPRWKLSISVLSSVTMTQEAPTPTSSSSKVAERSPAEPWRVWGLREGLPEDKEDYHIAE